MKYQILLILHKLWRAIRYAGWRVLVLPIFLVGERLLCAVLVLFTPRFSAMFFFKKRSLIFSKVKDSIIINSPKEKDALKYSIATLQQELEAVRGRGTTPKPDAS